jgi:N4-gp56 family major capsid protein
MANEYTTGMMWSDSLPSWQRDYYSMLMLETLRTKSILVPYCATKTDYAAAKSGVVIYTEVMDTEPNWNALTESSIWLQGAYMDSRTVRILLEIHGDILKFSDYNEIVQYVNLGNMRGLVKDKIGRNQTDYLDILARNAFLTHPNILRFVGGTAATGHARTAITATDLFDPDVAETVRVHLEENEVPGVAKVDDSEGPTIVCVTTPRVIKDIRTGEGSSKWLELQEYAGGGRKFNAEVGSWAGIRFVRTNRLRLRNHGAVAHQTALNGVTVPGQGAAQTVDTVYTVGQSTSTRYITVDDETGFAVGQYITIHDESLNGGAGNPPLQTDGSQETRRIVSIDAGNNRLVLDKPLLKPHADNNLVTNGRDVHASLFMGGPGVVEGIGEAPHPIFPPKYDDLMMVNRYGWRGFLKFQMFRPEFFEVVESAGSTD